jgi:phosphinothricin acetyltransferase
MEYTTRLANLGDIPSITKIFNQGVEAKIATFETKFRTVEDMNNWFSSRGERYKVLVVTDEAGTVHGWASLNVFNSRCCYSGVADMSVYVEKEMRGRGLGKILINYLEKTAMENDFHKLVLNTFEHNEPGHRLYKSQGFREVGTYMNHGIRDGKFVNITIMEKILG